MLELIKILIFGGNTVISPTPFAIGNVPVEIVLQEPLKALNCSASFNIEISEHIASEKYPDFVKEAESKFVEGCVKIELKSENGNSVRFHKQSITWESPKSVFLNLKANSDLEVNENYISLVVSSCKTLSASKLTWYNYGKFSCKRPIN